MMKWLMAVPPWRGVLFLFLASIFCVAGCLSWPDGEGLSWYSFFRCLAVLPFWIAAGGLFWYRQRPTGLPSHLLALLVLIVLVFVFLPVGGAPDFFYLHWWPQPTDAFGESWSERVLLLGVLFLVFRSFSWRTVSWLLVLVVLALQIMSFIALWQATGGEPLYRVDHPAFYYRLWSFAQMMPRFIYYDPFWNGGMVRSFLVASGTTAPGFFLWPLWRFIPTQVAYTPLFGLLFIVIVPYMAAFSVRLLSKNPLCWWVAALLAMATSHFTFIHLLHYGTFGSLFASAFLLPLTASLYRLYVLRKQDWKGWLVLFVSGAFLLCWPGVVPMALPFAVAFIFNIHRLRLKTLLGFFVVGCLLLLLHILPALSIVSHSDVGGFVQTTSRAGLVEMWNNGLQVLWRFARQSNPVLLLIGVFGVLFLPRRRWRNWFVPLLVVSLLFASWGKEWKEVLQFDRVWINGLYIAILPASLCIGFLVRRRDMASALAGALLLGMVVMGGYTSFKYMGNKGRANFRVMSDEMKEITNWISVNVPEDGRLLFAGEAGHNYGAAKVAALPALTGRQMMAVDFYGFSAKLVEYIYPPREFRGGGQEKLGQFFSLYHVTHIITVHERWKQFFRSHPQDYMELRSWGQKTIFAVRGAKTMFLEGGGHVTASLNHLHIVVDDPNSPVVIKYNWDKGLRPTPSEVKLSPYDTGTSVRLISIDPQGARTIDLTYTRWY